MGKGLATKQSKNKKKRDPTGLKATPLIGKPKFIHRQTASGVKLVPRKSPREVTPTPRFGSFATDQELQEADPYLMAIMNDDVATGRPGAFKHTWGNVYQNGVVTGWYNVLPNDYQPTGAIPIGVAHTVNCLEPTCRAASRVIHLNAQSQEIDAASTPHGRLQRPPICHKVPWAALKAYLDEIELNQNLEHYTDFVKFYCWYESNLGPGHNGCNAQGTHTTASTVTSLEKQQAKAIYDDAVSDWQASGRLVSFQKT